MNYSLFASTLVVGLGLLAATALPVSALAADSMTKTPATPAAAGAQSSIAAGAVEDTLQACMTRIPKDASLGQRLMAEQTCARDDKDRNPSQDTSAR